MLAGVICENNRPARYEMQRARVVVEKSGRNRREQWQYDGGRIIRAVENIGERSVKVVLSQDVKGVGKAGEVRDVADGHARNFLLRRKLAIVATEGAVKTAEAKQAASDRRAETEEAQAREEAARMSAEPIVLRAKMGDQ